MRVRGSAGLPDRSRAEFAIRCDGTELLLVAAVGDGGGRVHSLDQQWKSAAFSDRTTRILSNSIGILSHVLLG